MTTPVEGAAIRTIGVVESVAPDEIRVLLELDAPQSVALNAGQVQRFPRLNSMVLVPSEAGAIVGVVSWLGIERSPYPKRTGLRDFGLVDLPFPLRKMSLVPLGMLVGGVGGIDYELHRGVTSFPSVGDPVLLPSLEQQQALVEAKEADQRVEIGSSPLLRATPVTVDPDKLFGRHLAVLGNTGSGKSCSVAGLIRWSLRAAERARGRGTPNARFVVLDPNGEYRRTFSDFKTNVFEVVPDTSNDSALRVPAWMWNSHEWAAFAQAAPGTQRPLLQAALRGLRSGADIAVGPEVKLARQVRGYRAQLAEKIAKGTAGYSGSFKVNKDCGTLLANLALSIETYADRCDGCVDEIEAVVQLARETAEERSYRFARGTGYNDFVEPELTAVEALLEELADRLPEIGAGPTVSEDAPLPFDPMELPEHLEMLASSEEYASSAAFAATLTLRIRTMLGDARLAPVVGSRPEIAFHEWLERYIGTTDGDGPAVTVIDLSMVPSDVVHLVVSVIGRVIFEALQRYRKTTDHELPTVLVLEEAHSFVKRRTGDEDGFAAPERMCRSTFERIAREGRKFGLGLLLSSQRPSELSPTVLAQCNTFLLHRLVNDRDQDLVGRLVPDNLGSLLRELPSLPAQHAVLLGWAVQLPLLVRMGDLPREFRPHSADPSFWKVWTGEEERKVDWKLIADEWAGQATGGDSKAS